MNIVSDGEIWIFAGSNGTLTAGRVIQIKVYSPMKQQINFFVSPWQQVVLQIFKCKRKRGLDLWEPWIDQSPHRCVTRNLHKHADGSSLCFEEYHRIASINVSLGMDHVRSYGFVRICTLKNESDDAIELDLLDGLNRILPAGVDQGLYEKASYLAEAYMRHEKTHRSSHGNLHA